MPDQQRGRAHEARATSRCAWLLCVAAIAGACTDAAPPQVTDGAAESVADIQPTAVVPTPEQLAYQRMELIGFVHFTVNTFTDREWGYGDEAPTVFAPTALDADQWATIAAEVGMGELILTAKHHDGFALGAGEVPAAGRVDLLRRRPGHPLDGQRERLRRRDQLVDDRR